MQHVPHVSVSCGDIVLVRALTERGEHERLMALSDVLLSQSALYPNILSEIYIRIGMAAALHKLGHPGKAAEVLDRAVALAEPDGLAMPFVENAAHIAPVPQALSGEDPRAAFLARIAELSGPYAASVRAGRAARRAESGRSASWRCRGTATPRSPRRCLSPPTP
jgi:hypothetical protein